MRLEIQRKNQLAKSMLGPTRWLHLLSNCFADRSPATYSSHARNSCPCICRYLFPYCRFTFWMGTFWMAMPRWDVLTMDVGRFGWWDVLTHGDVLTNNTGTFWQVGRFDRLPTHWDLQGDVRRAGRNQAQHRSTRLPGAAPTTRIVDRQTQRRCRHHPPRHQRPAVGRRHADGVPRCWRRRGCIRPTDHVPSSARCSHTTVLPSARRQPRPARHCQAAVRRVRWFQLSRERR